MHLHLALRWEQITWRSRDMAMFRTKWPPCSGKHRRYPPLRSAMMFRFVWEGLLAWIVWIFASSASLWHHLVVESLIHHVQSCAFPRKHERMWQTTEVSSKISNLASNGHVAHAVDWDHNLLVIAIRTDSFSDTNCFSNKSTSLQHVAQSCTITKKGKITWLMNLIRAAVVYTNMSVMHSYGKSALFNTYRPPHYVCKVSLPRTYIFICIDTRLLMYHHTWCVILWEFVLPLCLQFARNQKA